MICPVPGHDTRKLSFAVDLDFGKLSVVGYVTYTGPVLEADLSTWKQLTP